MKIDRLYGITVYLLNHGRTPARKLADHFEVSVRTIQRDIDSLSLSGIPVVSLPGAAGGYELPEQFILDKHLATANDYSYILTALKGLSSATNDPSVAQTLEKVASLCKQPHTDILLDFSVLQEAGQENLQALQTAIEKKRVVNFLYTNNDGETRTHCVEPIAVLYRWYAWYLLAYSNAAKDYRTYKLVRMLDLNITDIPFKKEHEAAELILKSADRHDSRKYTELLVKCSEKAQARVREYLNGAVVEYLPNGGARMKLTVVENEQFWIGTLLSLGDEVEVIEPIAIRKRLAEAASKIVSLYA